MPPRATWKGHLKISLVSFPVRLYNAVSGATRISMNQLHKDCHRRLRQQMVCPEHGAVERDEIVRGYEYDKGKYVVVDDADLEKVRLETTKTIELEQFVDETELDPLFLDSPYYMAPDGPVAEEAFRVVREATKAAGKVGIGRVVMSGREHIVALKVLDRGFVLTTLRYADEVRGATPYFEEIKNGEVDRKQVELARQIIDSHAAEFDPAQFKDRYQDALLELVKAKIAGAEPVVAPEEQVGKVINLMEALKASVEQLEKKKPPARSVKEPAARQAKAKRA